VKPLVEAVCSQLQRYANDLAGSVVYIDHDDQVELFGHDAIDRYPKFEATIGSKNGTIWSELEVNITSEKDLDTFIEVYKTICLYETDVTVRVFQDGNTEFSQGYRNEICSKILSCVEETVHNRGEQFEENFIQEGGNILTAHGTSKNVEVWISYMASDIPFIEALIHSNCIKIEKGDVEVFARAYGK